MDSDWHYKSISEIHEGYRSLKILPSELVSHFYDRIEKLDSKLSAYVSLSKDQAYKDAKLMDQNIQKDIISKPLMGIPVALKDICDLKGYPTTGGSNSRKNYFPDDDSTVAKRLKDSGAIIIGKLALTEGAFVEHIPGMPAPKNPWNSNYDTGVSSSGAAVAVSSGLCSAAIGSDTGGSIRYPSICCGVTGLKPTYGRVSRHGIFPLAPSLDHIGPIARNVSDCAAIMNVISGYDPKDPSSVLKKITNYLSKLNLDITGIRIGYDPVYNHQGVDNQLSEGIDRAITFLSDLGGKMVKLELPYTKKITPNFTVLVAAEAYAEHQALLEKPELLGKVYKELLINGSNTNIKNYIELLKHSREYKAQLENVFTKADLFICPPWPTSALPNDVDSLGDLNDQGDLLRFTAPFNISGNPSITVPCGFNDEGLPIAFQLIAPHYKEELLLQVSNAYQSNTSWHLKYPTF